VREQSRFSRRDGDEAFGELKKIARAGVEVWFYRDRSQFAYGTFGDNILGFVKAEAAAEYRRQIAGWTFDAMERKARAGHVTGGRCFGYENVRVAGHVERRINEREATVVRRIFELAATGVGKISIAKRLNAEGASAPRAQQGRRNGWTASSVREVLFRDAYRGVIVWNRTKKRDILGAIQPENRPETEWIRVSAPELRLVSDQLWRATHERLDVSRSLYLRGTEGKLYGRPMDGVDRKYLLVGLAKCARCRGAVEVNTRRHGRHRQPHYSLSGAAPCWMHRRTSPWPVRWFRNWSTATSSSSRLSGREKPACWSPFAAALSGPWRWRLIETKRPLRKRSIPVSSAKVPEHGQKVPVMHKRWRP
jgi:DNA invertase Pin-like site-specific DNA recombinase